MKKHRFFFLSLIHPIRIDFFPRDNVFQNSNHFWQSPSRTVVPVRSVSPTLPQSCSCAQGIALVYNGSTISACGHAVEVPNQYASGKCAWHIRDLHRKWLRPSHETLPQ